MLPSIKTKTEGEDMTDERKGESRIGGKTSQQNEAYGNSESVVVISTRVAKMCGNDAYSDLYTKIHILVRSARITQLKTPAHKPKQAYIHTLLCLHTHTLACL